MGETEVL